jgi:hypothetical protein
MIFIQFTKALFLSGLFFTLFEEFYMMEQNKFVLGTEEIFSADIPSALIYFSEDNKGTYYSITLEQTPLFRISNMAAKANLTTINQTDLCYNSYFNIYNASNFDCDFPPPPPPLNYSQK